MDTRLTHAVAGYDPRLGATAIWTAHTAFGGAGSEVRWFEINTATTPVLSQTGTVTDPELYSFNGAISSDRAADDVTTTAAATGRNMVMGFNTSSAATFSAIKTLFAQHVAGFKAANTQQRGRDVTPVWTLDQLQDLLDEWLIVGFTDRR